MSFTSLEIADLMSGEIQRERFNGGRLVGRAKTLDELDGDFESALESLMDYK